MWILLLSQAISLAVVAAVVSVVVGGADVVAVVVLSAKRGESCDPLINRLPCRYVFTQAVIKKDCEAL